MKYANGDILDGEWKDDLKHGRGYSRTANGEYSGEWKDNLRNGGGTYRWANGD